MQTKTTDRRRPRVRVVSDVVDTTANHIVRAARVRSNSSRTRSANDRLRLQPRRPSNAVSGQRSTRTSDAGALRRRLNLRHRRRRRRGRGHVRRHDEVTCSHSHVHGLQSLCLAMNGEYEYEAKVNVKVELRPGGLTHCKEAVVIHSFLVAGRFQCHIVLVLL